jgi:hypothetical protein
VPMRYRKVEPRLVKSHNGMPTVTFDQPELVQ